MTKMQKRLLAIFLIVISAGAAARLVMSSEWYARRGAGALSAAQEKTVELITVDVDGAVSKPGVYRLPRSSTLGAAVDMAGGRARGADTRCINLTTGLKDRQKIYIPYRSEGLCQAPPPRRAAALEDMAPADVGATDTGEMLPADTEQDSGVNPAGGGSPADGPPGVVNINTASVQTLDSLPGIGPTYAQRIVALRNERGPFKTIEEIMLVKGIGESTFQKFKHLIKVTD